LAFLRLNVRFASKRQEQILDALKDGQSWLDSNPEADAEEIKDPPTSRKNHLGGVLWAVAYQIS